MNNMMNPHAMSQAQAMAMYHPFFGQGRMMEAIPMSNIVDPRDVDVLCGRGGAALRHPGNQTYRRLVNMNKAIYTTCLKTEKLKISRSIVAAIREQRGRFLERDGNIGTWYDIGDKKAIEKTSQALREGQPKLRQKMVEEGSGSSVPTVSLAHQFANGAIPGIQNPQMSPGMSPQMGAAAAAFGAQMGIPPPPPQSPLSPIMIQQQMMHNMQQMNNLAAQQQGNNQELSDMMMQRLNLSNGANANTNAAPPSEETNKKLEAQNRELTLQQQQLKEQEKQIQEQQRKLQEQQKQLQEQQEQLERQQKQQAAISRMQELSGSMEASQPAKEPEAAPQAQPKRQVSSSSADDVILENESNHGQPFHLQEKPAPPPPAKENEGGVRKLDRRRLFARMKFHRTHSGRAQARSTNSLLGGDLPDIHMVDSNFSLLSNISSGVASKGNSKSTHDKMKDVLEDPPRPRDDFMMISASRRSMMSGISRDSSEGESIFSDLSKKIGNVSTRSIAMSEISGIEEGNHEDIDESFHFPETQGLGRGGDLLEERSMTSRASSTLMPV